MIHMVGHKIRNTTQNVYKLEIHKFKLVMYGMHMITYKMYSVDRQ